MSSVPGPCPAGLRPALFLHIQKTAGTSIVNLARPRYAPSVTSHGDCWHRPPELFRDVGFVSGHFGYDFARHLMPGRFNFTFLREPRERILSMYYFCRQRDPARFKIYARARTMELIEFLEAGFTDEWVRKNIWNNQAWQLCHGFSHLDDRSLGDFQPGEILDLARQHLDQFNYVGFMETLAADQKAIFDQLGMVPTRAMRRENSGASRPGLADVPERARELLDELTALDRQLYTHAWQRHGVTREKPDAG
jgi:hypothetical protein